MIELLSIIFVESPIGLSIILVGGILVLGYMGYKSSRNIHAKALTAIEIQQRTDFINQLKGSEDVMHIFPWTMVTAHLQSSVLRAVKMIGLMPTYKTS